jgi:hypothetical protein
VNVADQRILQGTAATLAVTLTDQNGIAADAAGVLTVRVQKADGTDILAAGTATTDATGPGNYTVALTAAQTTSLDMLTATWTDAGDTSVTTTRHEIVGGYYVSIAAIRALKNLDDTSKFTDAELVAARWWFEDLVEQYTATAFVPRYGRLWMSGTLTASLLPPVGPLRSLRSARSYTDATNYTAFSASELADVHVEPWSLYRRTLGAWPYGTTNLLLEVEYGHDRPTADIREAALIAIRSHLLNDQTGRPMLSVSDGEGGTTRFATPGADRPTGIPDVDSVLNRYRMPVCA